ncbi:MAG: adenylate kinase family protein [Methanomicrobiaceae archaeon]|nr:adenylate kinase family protein [Methanomicrobiaceae archaeon]
MMLGITGTPGTGKTSVAAELAKRGHCVVHLADTVEPYVIEEDPQRQTRVVDSERWAAEFSPVGGIAEGHLAHLLACDRIVVLRCRPDVLRRRLQARGYTREKIAENVEDEALVVILIETVERHPDDSIFELDTTEQTPSRCADLVEQFIQGELPPSYGAIDWTEYLVLDL